jgi:hypothetical protein
MPKPQIPISKVKVTAVKCHFRACPAHNFEMHWAILFIFGMNVNLSDMQCHAQTPGSYLKGQGHSWRSNVMLDLAHNFNIHWAILFISGLNVNLCEM